MGKPKKRNVLKEYQSNNKAFEEENRRICITARQISGASKSRNKDGNKYLKVAFRQTAIGAVSFYPPVCQFYNKIRRRSGKHVAQIGRASCRERAETTSVSG